MMPMAGKGDPNAKDILGHVYPVNLGVPQGFNEPVNWYLTPAEVHYAH